MWSFLVLSVAVLGVVTLLTRPLGAYLTAVFSGERSARSRLIAPLERIVYRLCRITPDHEMDWAGYVSSLIVFNAVSGALLYGLIRLQGYLPLNQSGVAGQDALTAFNTVVSFVTNTNWQAYSGESGASTLSQMTGLTWQNFISAATGIAVMVALTRGMARSKTRHIGNAWVDITRAVLYVLLPISLALSLVFVAQGAIQNLGAGTVITTLESDTQTIPGGPVASQEAIKVLGTNGGGYFGANSAHPFENPTPLTNALQVIAMLAIPAGLTNMFGRFVGDHRQGWTLFAAMLILFCLSLTGMYVAERAGNPVLEQAGAAQHAYSGSASGNMEGKETRLGVGDSVLYATSTTAVSCGAVVAAHDSLTPLAGGLAMLNIMLGEVVFGGVGVGLAGMFLFALLAVFIAGLMVGRTPEYLGKKIGSREIQLTILAVLAVSGTVLIGAGTAALTPSALDALLGSGPHGLSEMLYAFASGAGNNGSAFGGLDAATPFYAAAIGIAMLLGRYLFIIPVLGIAGSFAQKKAAEESAGTFPTHGALFVTLLVGTVLIVGALTFFPALSLGPILEHFLMQAGTVL
ncbi:MAG: potassium-transporting ATPase subunit KdpA [Actinobacteria bacterium]|nr:potassium-transporting ATPase subunit KdpA [Actinomycetota bacterium]